MTFNFDPCSISNSLIELQDKNAKSSKALIPENENAEFLIKLSSEFSANSNIFEMHQIL